MNFKEFVASSQLFWANPNYSGKLTLILSLVSALILVAGIIVRFGLKSKVKTIPPYVELRNKFISIFVTCGVIGLFLALFSWQEIPYLSSHLLMLILTAIFVIWLIYILVYIKRDFSRQLVKREQDERYKKYLPRKKGS